MPKSVCRIEIEYEDGELRRGEGEEVDAIWQFYQAAAEYYLAHRGRPYEGPHLNTVRGPLPKPARWGEMPPVGPTLSELAKGELHARAEETKTADGPQEADQGGRGEVTDKERVIALCEKLGLKRDDAFIEAGPYADEKVYAITDKKIHIGAGGGYFGFYVVFEFDDRGNVLRHSVCE